MRVMGVDPGLTRCGLSVIETGRGRHVIALDVDGLAFDGLIGLALAAPLLLLWPFWLLAKALGARWRIVVERDGIQMETQLVRGWRRSGARIDELALQVARGWRSGHFTI